jgi:LysM repeat protein
MAVMSAINQKYGPLPLWSWGLIASLIAFWYMVHKQNEASASNQSSTQAAADQTNTDLGSASELANLFEVAGEMPYQGGDTYINITQPAGTTGTTSTGTTGTSGTTTVRSGTPATGIYSTPVPPKTTTGSTPASNVKSYTVKSGDTLIGIASKQFGLPATEAGADKVYDYDGNKTTIQSNAKAHGITSDFQHWIYAGETLKYPVSS